MRTTYLVIGILLLVPGLVAFIDGDLRISSLSACTTLELCPSGISPTGASTQTLLLEARVEAAIGLLLLLSALAVIVLAVTARSRIQTRDENAVKSGRPAEPATPLVEQGGQVEQEKSDAESEKSLPSIE